MERLQNLLFQMRAKVKSYEEKHGPLESDDIAETSSTVNEVSEIDKNDFDSSYKKEENIDAMQKDDSSIQAMDEN